MQEADIDGDQHVSFEEFRCDFTAKTVYRKFETNIPRNETARPQSQSYIHVSMSNFYIPMIGLVRLSCCRKIGGPIIWI
jgi:hypothetical protein